MGSSDTEAALPVGPTGTAARGEPARRRRGGVAGGGRVSRAITLGLALSVASGCATYTTVRPGSVAPGQEVRITLDPGAAPELTEFVSGQMGFVLVGTVTEREPEGLMVAVESVVREQGMRSEVFRQRVRVPDSEIVGLELRTIDRTRTGIAVALGVTAAVSALVLILSGEAGGSVEGTPQPPPQLIPAR